jgi:hypothetical protein
MARREGSFDDLMSSGLKLPWKAGLAAAAAASREAEILPYISRRSGSLPQLADAGRS